MRGGIQQHPDDYVICPRISRGMHAAVERLVGYREIDCPRIVPNEKQPAVRLAVNH